MFLVCRTIISHPSLLFLRRIMRHKKKFTISIYIKVVLTVIRIIFFNVDKKLKIIIDIVNSQ